MTQQHYSRTVEIRTLALTCDECGSRSAVKSIDSLMRDGWRVLPYLRSSK